MIRDPSHSLLSPDDVRRYDADGVVCVRGLFDASWVERMARAVDRIVAHPTVFGGQVSVEAHAFSNDLFLWKQDDDFRDFVYESPAARAAHGILRSERVNFFYDQIFVKPPGCHVPTPWHHDLTFWPIQGEQVCSIWMALDPVTRESSGLEFVRGSHRWPERFKAIDPSHNAYLAASDLAEPPDIDAHRERYDLLGWDLEPGDALLFDPLVVHGSSGNHTTDRTRRAFSTRWTGDDVRFDPRHPTMPLFWPHGLAKGDPLGGPLFPRILPEPLAAESARRARGPEPPDPETMEAAMRAIADYLRSRSPSRDATPPRGSTRRYRDGS